MFFPGLLRYKWQIKFYIFEAQNVMIWYMYYYEMITTIKLINTFITSHGYHFFWIFFFLMSLCILFFGFNLGINRDICIDVFVAR